MPFGYACRLRVEQDARRVHAARADDHDLPAAPAAPRRSCDRSTGRPWPDRLSSTSTRADDRVRANLELAGLQRERQQVIGGVEERRRVAAGAAVAAVVAGREAARRARHVGAPAGDDRDAQPCRRPSAAAARRSAAPAAAAGTCCPAATRIVVAAADADQLLDLVVVRRDVLVARSARESPSRRAPRALKSISE